MSPYRSVYATFKDLDQAKEIAHKIVEEGLVACVNIVPQITAIYRWEGKIEEDTEAAFFAKTQQHLIQQVTARIAQLHTYETPCIVVLPIESGHQPYLDWISGSLTRDPATTR